MSAANHVIVSFGVSGGTGRATLYVYR